MARNSRSSTSRNSSSSNAGRQKSRSNGGSTGVMDIARERPMAAAAVAAGAAAAGLFLWSKRSQISNQIASLSDQIGEWTENMSPRAAIAMVGGSDDTGGLTTKNQSSAARSTGRARSGMGGTQGINAGPRRTNGGSAAPSSANGRTRAQSAAPVPQ